MLPGLVPSLVFGQTAVSYWLFGDSDLSARIPVRPLAVTSVLLAVALVVRPRLNADDGAADRSVDTYTVRLGDTVSSWDLKSDGQWQRRSGRENISSQRAFIDIARAESYHLGPYEETLTEATQYRRKAKKPRKTAKA